MTDNEILETQLFEVVKNENNFEVDVVIARLEVLVALGVDVNVKDKDDRVALSYTDDERVRKYLILNGASVAEEGRGYFLEDIARLSMEKENERQEIRTMFKGRMQNDGALLEGDFLSPAQKKASIRLSKILAQKDGISSLNDGGENAQNVDADEMIKRAILVDEEIDKASKGFISKLKKLFGM
ncbi:MAG: hypothetical protein E7005_06970 [Alphaproteobacteria bacterium]|nr:hypothetical protein [Alphaproteobacteria bacterium]